MVKILHTADWQLGKQFENLGALPDKLAFLRQARLEAVRRIGKIAIEQSVDAILVAGDVFERNEVRDLILRETLAGMRESKVPWLLLPGNHDPAGSASVWERIQRIGYPEHVYPLLTDEPVLLADGKLAVLPAPLFRKHQFEDPTEALGQKVTGEGVMRVGLAHGSLRNRLAPAAEQYNMISDTRAEEARLDYLALGDWHSAKEVAPRTHYSGTPEPDDFDQDSGTVTLVELSAAGAKPKAGRVPVAAYRWYGLAVTLQSPGAVGQLRSQLSLITTPLPMAVVKLDLLGTVSLAERAAIDEELANLEAEAGILRVITTNLIPSPTEADLDELGRQGFVAAVVDRLRKLETETANPDSGFARTALQRLYLEHVLGGPRK